MSEFLSSYVAEIVKSYELWRAGGRREAEWWHVAVGGQAPGSGARRT